MKKVKLNISFFICIACFFMNLNATAQNASVTIQEDEKIPILLSLKKTLEEENKLTVGYTIQLYYGELTKANEILKDYKNNFTSWPASIEYETPNYKVWIGSFSNKLEADRARLEIAKKYPTAFILKADRG